MSKTNKLRKEDARAAEEARSLTPGKVVRLMLKSLVFALLVAVIILILPSLGVPVGENFWLQLGLMLVVYIMAYPFLMSEFRVKRPKG